MKRETLRHPKTYDLASRLDCSRPEVLGYLTLLWDFTAEVATDGAIGRWPDGSIARSCDWTRDPSQFVDALVDAGWLDRSDAHRLLVHDWPQHCERWVHHKLKSQGREFAVTTIVSTIVANEVGTNVATPPRDQPQPTPTNPTPTPGNGNGVVGWGEVSDRLASLNVVKFGVRPDDPDTTPEEILEVISVWERNFTKMDARDPQALLVNRIKQHVHGMSSTRGWPKKRRVEE